MLNAEAPMNNIMRDVFSHEYVTDIFLKLILYSLKYYLITYTQYLGPKGQNWNRVLA